MGKKVLVIEDDDIIREFVIMLLQEREYAVIAADNGSDGLQMAQQQIPDLIMSDLHMAGGDGLLVLNSVRKDPRTAEVPFVLVTADLNPEARQRCYAMGADQVFLKPFDPDKLVDTIGQLLAEHVATVAVDETIPIGQHVPAEKARTGK